MSEPPVPPPPAPSPFRPEAVKSAVPPGCAKPLMIGCFLVVVLLAATVTVFVTQQNGILRWTIKAMEAPLLGRLAAEVTEADKTRLHAAFEAAGQRAAAGTADLARLQRLQRRFLDLAGKPSVTREDVLDLTAMLEAFAGQPSPEAEPVSPEPSTPAAPPPANP